MSETELRSYSLNVVIDSITEDSRMRRRRNKGKDENEFLIILVNKFIFVLKTKEIHKGKKKELTKGRYIS